MFVNLCSSLTELNHHEQVETAGLPNRHLGGVGILCPPCRRELALLSAFSAKHPGVPVVLIVTDPSDNTQAVTQILDRFALPDAGLWRFGDAGNERLRYAIDPKWHGELPRSYLYDANGDRVGISGPLSDELLQRWLTNREGGAQF